MKRNSTNEIVERSMERFGVRSMERFTRDIQRKVLQREQFQRAFLIMFLRMVCREVLEKF